MPHSLGPLAAAVTQRLRALEETGFTDRLWAQDPTLYTTDPAHHAVAANRLGWLASLGPMEEAAADLERFAASLHAEGFRHALLLGMGGSSLCPEVLARTFGAERIDLRVLDSTDPAAVTEATRGFDADATLFVVASKSGSTIEVRAFLAHFTAAFPGGDRFLAITDPATTLCALARARGFRRVFTNAPDIGGRFSALSYFGLVPAALLGVDVGALVASARAMERACRGPADQNPGLELGAILAEAARAGRDKLTLVLDPPFESLGTWVEQLVAESTGKEGQGIVPVVGERLDPPDRYGDDRLFVHLSLGDATGGVGEGPETALDSLARAGHPVVRLHADQPTDLGGELLRWEVATAVAGSVLGIDPFDEPDVRDSKERTGAHLAAYEKEGALAAPDPVARDTGIELAADPALAATLANASGAGAGAADVAACVRAHLARIAPGDYVALLAYLPPSPAVDAHLEAIRSAVRRAHPVATTVGTGPRFLHSTGQLHKGGPENGVFIQIARGDAEPLPVPGEPYDFATLVAAQALGDFDALVGRGRRVIRCRIATLEDLAGLRHLLETALKTP